MKKIFQYFRLQKEIKQKKELFLKFFTAIDAYAKRIGKENDQLVIIQTRNEIILKQSKWFLSALKETVINDREQEEIVSSLFVEINIPISQKNAFEKLMENNIMKIDERAYQLAKVILHDFIHICTLYPYQGKGIFELDNFINKFLIHKHEMDMIEAVLTESIKDAELYP